MEFSSSYRRSVSAVAALVVFALASSSLRAAVTADDAQKKLDTVKVTLEFKDTPLKDALKQIGTLVGVAIVLDPEITGADGVRINLKIADMPAKQSLEWTLKLAELEYIIKDKEVFVTTLKNIDAAKEKAAK